MDVENADFEPQIDSTNANERKMARRLRIERRLEAIRMKNMEETGTITTTEAPKSPISKQIEKSTQLLEQLLIEGNEYISNVRIANDAREVDRRENEELNMDRIMEELDTESKLAEEKFQTIADKWLKILKQNDPLHINDAMQEQKIKCDELIEQKNQIIEMLRQELKKADQHFEKDQWKQDQDINTLTKRIENQIGMMRKAYNKELELIEKVMMSERDLMIQTNNAKWQELYEKRDEKEEWNSQKKSEELDEFIETMRATRVAFQEEYRTNKIRLENDIEELQRELERIKALVLINSEKIDYNYQILKKREDENIIIRSQQKRHLIKLQDTINMLRKKIADYHKYVTDHTGKLKTDIKKLQKNINDCESKADRFAKINDQKFHKIWNFNREKIDELKNKLLTIDRILHEQLLGLRWIKPQYNLIDRSELPSYKSAKEVLSFMHLEELQENKSEKSTLQSIHDEKTIDITMEETASYRRVIKKILEQISIKSNFLMEDKLNEILKPYLKENRTLIRLDNVFAALNIKEQNDIDVMVHHFLPYCYCENCTINLGKNTDNESDESIIRVESLETFNLEEKSLLEKTDAEIEDIISNVTTKFEPIHEDAPDECKDSIILKTEFDEISSIERLYETTTKSEMQKISCRYYHNLIISPVYILKALDEFMQNYYNPKPLAKTVAKRLMKKHSTLSRLLDPDDISNYWNKLKEILPDERLRIWNSLYKGLDKYHDILKKRKELAEEMCFLRKQNYELKLLVNHYTSK